MNPAHAPATARSAGRPSLRPPSVPALQTARENLAYWTMKKAQATTPVDRSEAGARVLLWKYQIASLTSGNP